MSVLRIEKLNSVPAVFTANTLYFIKNATDESLELYLSDSAGLELKQIPSQSDTLSKIVIFSDISPSFPCVQLLWYDTSVGTLNIQYTVNEISYWVEAMQSIAVPDFAGNGTAVTMSRSDHYHSDVTLLSADW